MSNNTTNSEIKFQIELDENKVPEKLSWTARDGGIVNEEAKAIMLSIWNSKNKETLRIDLWTKDMPVDEMKIFFHQTLVAMADTYDKATQDDKNVSYYERFLRLFCGKIGVEIIKVLKRTFCY